MPAGVRLTLRTDAPRLTLHYQADPAPVLQGPQETARLDVVVDGTRHATLPLRADGADAELAVALPGRLARVELWLPPYHQLRVRAIELAPDARLARDDAARPRWVHDGSSISQGRGAASPARTWTARVARGAGLDLTCLALGAACHMQPMTARLMRDTPAELLSACVGINSQALGALNAETFLAAAVGFVRTVRERHPHTPFVLLSTTYAAARESTPGPSGLTLAEVRALVARAVALLREHGDRQLHHLDGRELLGPADAHLFLERDHPGAEPLHPGPAGHVVVAARFRAALDRFGVLPPSL